MSGRYRRNISRGSGGDVWSMHVVLPLTKDEPLEVHILS